jgi:hypothetical protein
VKLKAAPNVHQFFGENDVMKKVIVILVVLLSACASVSGPKEKPWIYEEPMAGNHSALARCVVSRLQSDSRWSIRMLQFSNRLYPDIDASEVYAYDMRFLPGVFARNSPTNPDAVFDYADLSPEALPYGQHGTYTGPDYAFALMIKKIDDNSVMATLKGSKHVGGIAWEYLQACAQVG